MSIGAGPGLSNYPYGFANGISIRGVPLVQTHPGQAFWVYNGTNLAPQGRAGSDGNRGTFDSPFASLNFAVSQCVAGRGDVIFLKPGHAETISTATALALNIADVAVIGLGVGAGRPTFTLDTATTTTIGVSANNVSIQNCRFNANFAAIAALFTLTTAKYFTLDNCDIKDLSSTLNFVSTVVTNTTDAAADGLAITNNRIASVPTSGANNLLVPAGSLDRATIQGNYFSSLTTNAGAVIPIAAGKILTNLLLLSNYFNLVNAAATATGYLITTNGTTNSGFIDGNKDHCLANTTYASSLMVTANSGFVFGQNWHSRTADKSPGVVLPAADT